MKFFRFIIFVLAIFSITTNVYAKYNKRTIKRYVKAVYKFNVKVKKLKTPKKLVRYNFYHFSYLSDKKQFGIKNYWQDPLQFFINKKGDCEDYAIWNYYILSVHGYQPQFVRVKNKESKKFHAIVKITYKNNVLYIDMCDCYRSIPPYYEFIRIHNQYEEIYKTLNRKIK